ncbi:MAG: hypothetical protein PHW01_01275 [Patescibacteria group bacterium]|nr:hypothetical protein [Patescibacteria group bacterium]
MKDFNVSFALWYIKHRRLIDWMAIVILIAVNAVIGIYIFASVVQYLGNPRPAEPGILVTLPVRNVAAEDLEVVRCEALPSGNKYNLVAVIRNPNPALGLQNLDYKFFLFNAQGEIIKEIAGASYILPGETQYIIRPDIEVQDIKVERATLELKPVGRWLNRSDLLSPSLSVLEDAKSLSLNPLGQLELFAIVQNQGYYNFKDVEVKVVCWGENDAILAVNYTTLNNFYSNTKREFRMRWLQDFRGEMQRMDIFIETNIYNPDNFLEPLPEDSPQGSGEYRDI